MNGTAKASIFIDMAVLDSFIMSAAIMSAPKNIAADTIRLMKIQITTEVQTVLFIRLT